MDIDLYMRVAYAALLFIFVLCGVLRCLDFWTPLGGKNADELYPARRVVACIYFSVVLLLPCALHPQSTDAQLLARCFWVLFIPAVTAMGYKRFFFGDKRHKWLRIALVGGVPMLFTLALSCIALAGGDMLAPYRKGIIHAAGILGALLTAYEIHVLIWLCHIMSGADAAARAADKLFPKNFALGMSGVSLAVLAVTWWIFLFEGMQANAAFAGIIAFIGLLILLVILHPQRVEKKAEDGKDKKNHSIKREQRELAHYAEHENGRMKSNGVTVMAAVTPNGDTVQVAMPDDEQPGEDAVAYVKAAYPAPTPDKAESERTEVMVEVEDSNSEEVCEVLPLEEASTDEEATEDVLPSEVDDEPMGSDACCMEEEEDLEEEDAGNADMEEDSEDEDAKEEDTTSDEAPQDSTQPKEKKYTLSDAQLDNIERQIRNFVEGKKQYLDPTLTRKTLEKKLGVNRLYLSEVFARRFGSLTLYLNTLRMEHFIRYAAEHPNAKLAEVVHHSGFGSDNSYYRAKDTYEAGKLSPESQKSDNQINNSDLCEGFLPN